MNSAKLRKYSDEQVGARQLRRVLFLVMLTALFFSVYHGVMALAVS